MEKTPLGKGIGIDVSGELGAKLLLDKSERETRRSANSITVRRLGRYSDSQRCAGAILVDNFTIVGNSLGSVPWQGEAEWFTGFGTNSKSEKLDCGARFKYDVNQYLNYSGSHYDNVQVGNPYSRRLALSLYDEALLLLKASLKRLTWRV